MDIITILILPIHVYRISFHLFVSSISFINVFFFNWVIVVLQCCVLSTVQQSESEFPVLYSRFSLFINFTHISVYMLVPISQLFPPFPHLGVHMFVLYISVSISALVHLYHFSRFHKYVLIYDICFSLTYFTLYDRL